jgi:cobalamin biosynthesis protein CobC
MRDHGGNLDAARALWGQGDWIDLSTGINRMPYPLPALPLSAWTDLPTKPAMAALLAAARSAYRTEAPIAALSGAQGAIQLIPHLARPGLARILAPTYNEHAAALRRAGWRVEEVSSLGALAGADLALVVNPNNPTGAHHAPADLLALLPQTGRLVVDESFADPVPGLSLAARAGQGGLVVLRSFGKFYGLAGLRLGFVLGSEDDVAQLAEMAGPWPVSGAALAIGTRALLDESWQEETTARLAADAAMLDETCLNYGWQLLGGTHLFRSYHTPDAASAQALLARNHVWSRIFPYSPNWLRLGLPGSAAEWSRLPRQPE